MIPIAVPQIGEEEKRAVLEVLGSGRLAQGEKVKKFEENFAEFIGARHAVAVSNGTMALHTALLACGVKPGNEVITTPFSFIATANAIIYCGAKPVFADIDPRTFNIDAEQIEDKITKKTSAIIPVPLYGHACDMDPINEIADEHGLRVVEDACQAHGAEYKGRKVGALGDCGVFSFYPTKNMTTGEGGMMTTNEEKIAERARLIRAHGSSKKYHHEILGYNYRMTEISAAIGIEQLRKLDEMNERRIKNADMLTEGISKIEGLTPPYILPDTTHVFHQYTVRVTKEFSSSRDELVAKLNNKGIGAGIYYPIPIHKQELYQKLNYAEDLPEAEKAAGEVLSLPVHPAVSEKDIKFIISSLG